MSQLQDFIDREEELEIFLQMLSAERQEQVLDICAGGGETLHALAEVFAMQGDWAEAAEMAEQAAEAWRRAAEGSG